MADDYTLIFLGELAAGLLIFCPLSGYAYHRIRQYKKNIAYLTQRLHSVQTALTATRHELSQIEKEAENRTSQNELEHAISLFSLHVLHHLPRPKATISHRSQKQAFKTQIPAKKSK